MRLLAARVLAVLALALAASATPAAGRGAIEVLPGKGASGGDAIFCWKCDLVNFSNLQGGTMDEPNFDVGAGGDGSPGHPRGRLSLCFDVCTDTVVWNTTGDLQGGMLARFGPTGISLYGGGRLMAKIGARGIVFYGPVTFAGPVTYRSRVACPASTSASATDPPPAKTSQTHRANDC